MRDQLTWRDVHSVVHVMVNDYQSEREPPYTLMSACLRTHHHAHSDEMRRDASREAITCLYCVVYYGGGPAVYDDPDAYDQRTYAPCCT